MSFFQQEIKFFYKVLKLWSRNSFSFVECMENTYRYFKRTLQTKLLKNLALFLLFYPMFSGGTGREHDMEWVKINLLITNFIASIFGDNPFVLPVPKAFQFFCTHSNTHNFKVAYQMVNTVLEK